MCETPSQLNTDLSGSGQSDVINLAGINPINCTEVSMSQVWDGGVLIFSDSPETPTVHGKLYYDTGLSATVGTDYNRVFLYHVNGHNSKKMKFAALIKNASTSSGTLTVQKTGSAGPTTSYLYGGKVCFQRWLSSSAGSGVSVAAGAWAHLDSGFASKQANKDQLMHGIWDYSFDRPHEILIVGVYSNEDPVNDGPGLSLLSRDSHQRGTFHHCDKVYDTTGSAVDTASDIQQFPLAGGTTNDSYVTGSDATDGTSMTLTGNYGVLYRMHLNITSSDGKDFGFLMNPRGGAWGGAVWTPVGITPGGKFLIPTGTTSVSSNASGSVEGKYDPSTTPSPWLQWMPTGGSALPLRFVFVPFT